MICERGDTVLVSYWEGDVKRHVKGKLLEETPEYFKIELNNYITTIFREYVIKIESVKRRRE